MKKKIMFVSDSARINSGFSRVVRELATRLHNTGKYEVCQHGWFDNFATQNVPFQLYRTRVHSNGVPDERDKYGHLSFDDVCAKVLPDLVIGVGDPSMLTSIYRSNMKWRWKSIFYCPVDGFPVHKNWKPFLEFPDRLILFGEWSKKLIEKGLGVTCHSTIYHGVDTSVFSPVESSEKRKDLRRTHLKNTDSFLFGFVGRNSERKRVDLVVQAVALLRYGHYGRCYNCHRYVPDPLDQFGNRVHQLGCRYCHASSIERGEPKDVKLLLHTPINDKGPGHELGSSIEKIMHSFDMEEHVYLDPTYTIVKGCKDRELVEKYQMMDCYLSFAMEGFGIPLLEAMACGIPIITGNYSAYPEWCNKASLFVEAETWMSAQGSGLLRPVPDLGQFLEQALLLMETPLLARNLSREGRQKAETMSWDLIAKEWEREIDSLLLESSQSSLLSI